MKLGATRVIIANVRGRGTRVALATTEHGLHRVARALVDELLESGAFTGKVASEAQRSLTAFAEGRTIEPWSFLRWASDIEASGITAELRFAEEP